MKKTLLSIFVVAMLISVCLFIFYSKKAVREAPANETPTITIRSFNDCIKAGYPVMESYPRQCKTADGRTYAEELQEKILYKNASSSMIVVDTPFPGAVTGKKFLVKGKARGTWFFEASFPVVIIDKDGKILAEGPAKAQSDWMTTDFVPFTIEIKVPDTYIGKATLLLKKDNPSGLEERDASISFPITIEY